MSVKSANLNTAKKVKNDEFYTQLTDIQAELSHYDKHYFKNKVIYCNCDDPQKSNFWKYFYHNFHTLHLKKIVSTHFVKHGKSFKLVYDGNSLNKTWLKGNGDFSSLECVALLKQCDLVVTNPPFSLAKKFLLLLTQLNINFIIVGDLNWVTMKNIWPLVQSGKLRFGFTEITKFIQPDGSLMRFGNKLWFTTLNIQHDYPFIKTTQKYQSNLYPQYDNYEAIEISKLKLLPNDYDGIMGVPITFLKHYNPKQFELIGADYQLAHDIVINNKPRHTNRLFINGKRKYARLLIRKANYNVKY